jgi:hypothetical protein
MVMAEAERVPQAIDCQLNDGKHVMLNVWHMSFIKYRIHILRPATSPYFAVLAI